MTRQELCEMLRRLKIRSCAKTIQSWPFILQLPMQKIDGIENGTVNFSLSECLLYMNIWQGQMELANYGLYDCITTTEEVRDALVQLRQEACMSFSELSAASGVAYNTIKNYENRMCDLRIDTFLQLVGALGCTLKIE